MMNVPAIVRRQGHRVAFPAPGTLLCAAAAAVALLFPSSTTARDAGPEDPFSPPDADRLVQARLVASRGGLVPGGTVDLGLVFTMERGWHLYWNGRNDTGFPITMEPRFPGNFAAGELLWPAPHRHVSAGPLLDHIYEDRVTLVLPVTVPSDARPGETITLACDLSWAVCREMCIIGQGEVSIALPVVASDPPAAPEADRALLERARSRLPRPLSDSEKPIEVTWQGESLTVHAPRAERVLFYPDAECGALVDAIADGEAKGDRLTLRFKREDEHLGPAAGVLEIRGRASEPELIALHRVHPEYPASRDANREPGS